MGAAQTVIAGFDGWRGSETEFSDLSPLAKLTKLNKLDLRDTPVNDEEVAKLQKALPNCEIIR